ncbi:ESX secretion-associated protein EspG [Nocardia uniformis]|uniref:ESX secretion-associated protein EspG n=1 Tax=Nocardia uniformis TaxID=53432 RepID=A0A849CA40_9NOCA|nr:ESX secretion-associated protein EspG [Nocardia uniformis]NNH73230.1 ESX secretion-associated protein EspG [Nocardia uniformis]
MDSDPVAVEVNVDAALLLQRLVGIDSYPPVLALLPNIFRIEDRDRVHEVVRSQLAEAGIVDDEGVHPQVAHWLQCLYRPDMELVARIMDTGADEVAGMLRMSMVRAGSDHVLAVRNDDHIIIQSVYQDQQDLRVLVAALAEALGPCPAVEFEPVTARQEDFADNPTGSVDQRKQLLLELGAVPHTAGVLSRAFEEVLRHAEIVVVEHHDGGSTQTEMCVNVFDTEFGRIVATPSIGLDGQRWTRLAPGDDSTLHAGVVALLEMLPGRSWFDTGRA